jgi:hypothetical protein
MAFRAGPVARLRRRRGGLLRLRLCGTLLIERNEIHGIEQERRETAVADRCSDDFARKRKQKARAFDHDHGLHLRLRDIQYPEYAGECQVEDEKNASRAFGFSFQLERNFIVGFRKLLDADIDLNLDVGLRLIRIERTWRIRILEREVLDVLSKNVELCLLWTRRWLGRTTVPRSCRRAAIAGSCHETYPFPARRLRVWRVANTGACPRQGCKLRVSRFASTSTLGSSP